MSPRISSPVTSRSPHFTKHAAQITTKGGSRRLEKSRKVWMMMMIVASLMWAGAAERERERERERPKMALKS